MKKVKCYYITCPGQDEYDRPIYYKVIGTYGEMDDFCSDHLWARGEDPEIEREREATEEELNEYENRKEKEYPLIYESIKYFE